MKMTYKKILIACTMVGLSGLHAYSGNEDRAGSAGSTDLLINPWAKSSGIGNANSAIVRGLEATFMNPAGMSFTEKTEVIFAHTRWLAGSDIGISAFGFSQNLGKKRGVVGMSIISLGSGPIVETTVEQPEGTGATYQVNNLNIGVTYAQAFSQKIRGGFTVRIINQSVANVNASGFAIDAGIQYYASLGNPKSEEKKELRKDNLVFGIALKNIGPRMSAVGDGLTVKNVNPINGFPISQSQRSADYEMPALMNIGVAYIYRITQMHILNFAFNFTSHSFTRDQFILGAEYSFGEYVAVRGAYTFEKGLFGERDGVEADLLNAFTGPSAGISVMTPFKKGGRTKLGIDYSFRGTYNFAGVHSFGARLIL